MERITLIVLFFAVCTIIHCDENGVWLRTSCKLFCIEKETFRSERKSFLCKSDKCFKCLESCSLDVNKPCTTQCPNTTSGTESCMEPCNFLKERYNEEKPGTCPSVPNGFELADVGRCVHDSNCSWAEKCCKNGKTKTCQQPAYVFNSTYPPLPVKVRVKKITSSLLVSWQFPLNPPWKNATMFVVEERHSSKHLRPSDSDYSFWKYAGETTAMEMLLKNLIFGYWYQLRVIAYSLYGTNGHSKHSRSIRMNFEIRRPSRPRNFTALGAWFEDSKISVKISWLPPLILDRPVRRYRVIYFKHVDGTDEHYLTIPVKTKKIPGKETSVILTELESNAIYVVKIQAMLVVKRGKRIKGRWKIMYLKTPPIKKMPFPMSKDQIRINSSVVPTTVTNFSVKLDCVRVFLAMDGAVSAVIRWKVPDFVVGIQFNYFPEKCRKRVKNRDKKTILLNAGKNEVTLFELYEDCYYTLRMKTYFPNNSEAPFQKTIFFSTYPKAKTTTSTIFSEELKDNKSSRIMLGITEVDIDVIRKVEKIF